tara:strand:- start:250 stop:483 length:234 start_codon:yes stop_codon:yes gene_type:complete
MFRRLLMTLSRDMPNDARLGYQVNFPITNQIREFNGSLPQEWSCPVGPIVPGNTFGFGPYGGPLPPPPPPPPPAGST